MDGIRFVDTVHGDAGVQGVLGRHAVEFAGERTFPEIPSAQEIIFQAGADEARRVQSSSTPMYSGRFEETEVVRVLALHGHVQPGVATLPVDFQQRRRLRAGIFGVRNWAWKYPSTGGVASVSW